jgi:CBS domain-containing protein
VGLKVHHLFVVDTDGTLTGVISALDVLKYVRPEQPSAPGAAPTEPPSSRSQSGDEPRTRSR